MLLKRNFHVKFHIVVFPVALIYIHYIYVCTTKLYYIPMLDVLQTQNLLMFCKMNSTHHFWTFWENDRLDISEE